MRRACCLGSAAERAADRICPVRLVGTFCRGGNPQQCACEWCNAITGYEAGRKAAMRRVQMVEHETTPVHGWHAGWYAGFKETREQLEAADAARQVERACRLRVAPAATPRRFVTPEMVRRAYAGDPAVRLGQGEYARELCHRETVWEGGVA